jgi:molecular chaperone GrpE
MMSQKEDPAQEAAAAENVETSSPDVDSLKTELEALRASLAIKDATIEGLRKKISEYESKISEIREFVKKMEQETVAIRDRAKRDLEKNAQAKSADFLRGFLPLIDNLDRSLEAAKEDQGALAQGIRLIRRELEDITKAAGLRKIATMGEAFDPNIHEALGSEATSDDHDGRVTRELRSGYIMGELVVRVAQVMVGRKA